ncbi:MAG: hypothetical protein PVI86_09805, partial [Phycisphaerae bacterium]
MPIIVRRTVAHRAVDEGLAGVEGGRRHIRSPRGLSCCLGLAMAFGLGLTQVADAQVTFEEFTEAKVTANQTSITVSTPAGASQGDLLVTAVVTDGNTSTSLSPPGGEGWQVIALDGANSTLGVWYKIAGASESPTHTFTWGSGEQSYAWMMRFTGHDGASPIDASAVLGGTSAVPTCPSVTTTVPNALILRLGGFDDDDVTIDSTGLSGHTGITMDESTSGFGTCSGGAGYLTQATSGASGTVSFALTATEQYRTATVAIRPGCTVDGDCDDGVTCTDDTCVGGNCVYTANDANCDDANLCNGLETCDPFLDCQPGTCDTVDVFLDQDFSADAGTFAYQDDTFRGTSNPSFASGTYEAGEGEFGDGAVQVHVGGNSTEMSGGWASNFTVSGSPSTVDVEVTFRLLFSGGYESDEIGEALLSIDGTLYGVAPNDYLRQFVGDAATNWDTGWVTETLSVTLGDGAHQIIVGGYNNKSTVVQEVTDILFDSVRISSTTPGVCDCDDGLYCNGTDTCVSETCVPGSDPCPGQMCDETNDICVDCLVDGDCDDSNVCTDDACVGGVCQNTNNTGPCDDGLYCTDTDTCSGGSCSGSGDTCPGQFCDETNDQCVDCFVDGDCDDSNLCTDDACVGGACQNTNNTDPCDDGLYCTVTDACSGGSCVGSGDACPGQVCDETNDVCVDCLGDGDCDDGEYCNGIETCVGNVCQPGTDPCPTPGEGCDDGNDVCAVVKVEAGSVAVAGSLAAVNLDHTYTSPVIICSARYSNNDTPIVTRLDNVTSTSFDVRLQNPSNGPVVTAAVSYLVVEEGVWELDGVKFEAQKYLSTVTDTDSSWTGQAQTYGRTYVDPVVVGQVMSSNAARWSVFWCRGSTRAVPPSPTTLFTGKTVCEDPLTARANETVGFVVFERDHTTIGTNWFEARLGAATVQGVDDSPPYEYTFDSPFPSAPDIAITSMGGMIDTDGGWAQTHGPTPTTNSRVRLSINEDQLSDSERSHSAESVAYVVFDTAFSYPECIVDGDCDDSNVCTDDACVGGVCQNTNNTDPCDDGLYCTLTDTCSGGSCVGSGDRCPGQFCDEGGDVCADCLVDGDCDDSNVCTDDACVGGVCQNTNNTDPCDDGLYCTLTDTCSGGSCVGSGDRCPGQFCDEGGDVCADCLVDGDCDDSNVCTDDACVGGVCQNTNNTDPCDDGLYCTLTDTCSGGSCVGSGDPCPGQFCDEGGDVCAD